MNLRVRGRSRVIDVLLIAALAVAGTIPAFATETHQFDVPAEDAPTAIRDFATQAHVQILVAGENVKEKHLHAVSGEFSTEQGLRLLLADSGLSPQYVGDRSIALVTSSDSIPPPKGNAKEGKKNSSSDFRVAQVDQTPAGPQAVGDNQNAEKKKKEEGLTEIVVTGTHIRGVTVLASSMTSFSRDDIAQSGAGTVSDFMDRIPQNFVGGASSNSMGTSLLGGGDTFDRTGGSGVNLRGLGNGATLVLIDGRRVAPGNVTGNFVDVSMIPMAAVQRIDISTDGASAIYGSDAVGGVVNFVLRDNFDGAETFARAGSVTDGSHSEYDISQTIGHTWSGGAGMVSAEFYHTNPLSAADRPFSDTAQLPFTLLPYQQRESLFFNVRQDLGGFNAFANAIIGHRASEFDVSSLRFISHSTASINTYNATVGVDKNLGEKQLLEFSATYSGSGTHEDTIQNAAPATSYHANSSVLELSPTLDGTLWHMRSGEVRYAIGAEYRSEHFRQLDLLAETEFKPSRAVYAGFAELNVPVVSPDMGVWGVRQLSINLADRLEHYSDFGSTNNPKFGVVWTVFPDLKLRGSYGKSFQAPNLNDLNPEITNAATFPLRPDGTFNPGAPDNVNTLALFGGNPNLQPEKATSWTAGLDFTPEAIRGLRLTGTYYDIRFTNRVTNLQGTFGILELIQNAAILGPTVIQFNPALSTVKSWYANPHFSDYFGIPATSVNAIADLRIQNLSGVSTHGVDFGISYDTTLQSVHLTTGIDGTRILGFTNQVTPKAPVISILDTTFNPIHLRIRGKAVAEYRDLTLAAFINYVGNYDNNQVTPQVPAGSWTTVDASATYALHSGPLSGFSATVGSLNLLNRDPPFVGNSTLVVNYDGANANPVRRFVYLNVSYKW